MPFRFNLCFEHASEIQTLVIQSKKNNITITDTGTDTRMGVWPISVTLRIWHFLGYAKRILPQTFIESSTLVTFVFNKISAVNRNWGIGPKLM